MLVGYMRVSTDSDRQVLDLQRDALLSAGVDERHLFEDRASGAGVIVPASAKPSPSSSLATAWSFGNSIGWAGPCRISSPR